MLRLMPLGSYLRSNHGHVADVRTVTRTLLATVHGVGMGIPYVVAATVIARTLWDSLHPTVKRGLERFHINPGLSQDTDGAAEAGN